MRYLNRNRFVRGGRLIKEDSTEGGLRKFSDILPLSRSFLIISYVALDCLIVAGDQTPLFISGELIILAGSQGKINDAPYEIISSWLDNGNTTIHVKNAIFTGDIEPKGFVYINKNISITHGLNTKSLVVELFNLTSQLTAIVDYQILDSNNLILIPEFPSPNEYQLTILG